MSDLKKSILVVADVSISSVIGGAERVLYEQTAMLVRRGYHVDVLTRRMDSHLSDKEDIAGVREWRYKVKSDNPLFFLMSSIRNSRVLFETLYHKKKIDAIIFHQPFSAFGILRSPYSRTIKKQYVCHSLSFEEFYSRNDRPASLLKAFLFEINVWARKHIEKKVLQDSDHIVALSKFTKDKLITLHQIDEGKISVIPGGIDLVKFQPASEKKEIRQKLDLPANKIILLTVRNLIPRMGLENLISAVSNVLHKIPEIYLVLGGTGPLEYRLKKMTRRREMDKCVKFTGFIPESVLPDYYRAADLFVLPTKDLEGFGLVTLEALASGVPVLGTPVGGTKEILSKFDPGFLFQDTSPASLTDLISEKLDIIKNHPEKWQKISLKCRRFIEENYSWKRHVDALEKHF